MIPALSCRWTYSLLVLLGITTIGLAGLEELAFRTSPLVGLEAEIGVCRRDPSDVIRFQGRHFVFYSKARAGMPLYPSGYPAEVWYASSEDDGRTWRERGVVIDQGPVGSFDSFGAFTPNVLECDGELYIYYTGVGDNFDNARDDFSPHNRTAIGAAQVRLHDDGNVASVERLNGGEPILIASDPEAGRFDSFRVDDAVLFNRQGQVWLYYKGRRHGGSPGGTKMGLAIAPSPEGPFVRQTDGRAVQPEGHEVMVWPHGAGLLSVVSAAGRGLYYAGNGLTFRKVCAEFQGRIHAPGVFRPDLAGDEFDIETCWGISMMHGPHPYLVRWDATMPSGASRLAQRKANPAAAPIDRPTFRATQAGWRDDDRWTKQVEDIHATLEKRGTDLELVFLGDSITQSLGGPDRQVWAPGAAARKKHFAAYEHANFGISGDQTQHILWRLAQEPMARLSDATIVLMIGTNNVPHHTPEEIAGGIEAIVSQLTARKNGVRVLLLGILPRGPVASDPARQHVALVNRLIAHLDDREGVTYLDLTSRFVDTEGRLRQALYAPDGLHLRAAGYEVWAQAVAAALADPVTPEARDSTGN